MTSIDQARTDVQQAVRALMAIADSAVPTSAASAEQRLWSEMLALGRALMTLFFARQAARWQVGRSYDVDGQRFVVVGTETSEVGTRFGKARLEQPVGLREGDPNAARDRPLQRELGLPAGFTMLVVSTMAGLCAQMAFASARDPPFALERIEALPDGRIAYLLKVPRKGRTHRIMTPTEFMAGLAALSPRPVVVAPAGDAEAAAGSEAEAVRRDAVCVCVAGGAVCACVAGGAVCICIADTCRRVADGCITYDGVDRGGGICGRVTWARANGPGRDPTAHRRHSGRRADYDRRRSQGPPGGGRAVRVVEAPRVGGHDEEDVRVCCSDVPEMQPEDGRDRDDHDRARRGPCEPLRDAYPPWEPHLGAHQSPGGLPGSGYDGGHAGVARHFGAPDKHPCDYDCSQSYSTTGGSACFMP